MSGLRAAAPVLAVFCGILALATESRAQQSDPFTAACMTRKDATPAKCACQSKLARANLDRREQQMALAVLRGDKDGYNKQVKAIKPEQIKTFQGKMDKLGAQSRTECR